jgi:hypothetical protein
VADPTLVDYIDRGLSSLKFFMQWDNNRDIFFKVDVIVKSRDQTAKKKDPDARRANPEE